MRLGKQRWSKDGEKGKYSVFSKLACPGHFRNSKAHIIIKHWKRLEYLRHSCIYLPYGDGSDN